ncbi:hypothetical protein [Tenggerimyces flavus]|uniref:Uncharacterized protein n=1 Tax=Tenggerimyces flavus TaxID=1708749 RepID=A0ABV7YJQ7_9ACTN|nr:hypothetical protein [Tenggerimyces flavus]MBM7784901.1 hypothetical protein [Tenggerimyces flavus]
MVRTNGDDPQNGKPADGLSVQNVGSIAVTVKVWLDGHEFDLQDLADLLPSGDTRVVKEGTAFYLTSTQIDNRSADVQFYEIAQQLLPTINGLGRANHAGFRPVSLSGRYDDGDQSHTVVGAATIEARARMHAAGVVTDSAGVPRPDPPPPGPARASLAATNPHAREVLAILGQPQMLGWVELYKVHEIIRDSIGKAQLQHLAGTTPTMHSAFTASANRPDVSGSRARHARMGGSPPKHSMTEGEGRDFVSRLVTAWLDSLAQMSREAEATGQAPG